MFWFSRSKNWGSYVLGWRANSYFITVPVTAGQHTAWTAWYWCTEWRKRKDDSLVQMFESSSADNGNFAAWHHDLEICFRFFFPKHKTRKQKTNEQANQIKRVDVNQSYIQATLDANSIHWRFSSTKQRLSKCDFLLQNSFAFSLHNLWSIPSPSQASWHPARWMICKLHFFKSKIATLSMCISTHQPEVHSFCWLRCIPDWGHISLSDQEWIFRPNADSTHPQERKPQQQR